MTGRARCRKGSQRALDELQRTIVDVETKYKAEMGRLKKKHESDVRDYEIQVETLNRNNGELSKANKSLAARIKVWQTHNVGLYTELAKHKLIGTRRSRGQGTRKRDQCTRRQVEADAVSYYYDTQATTFGIEISLAPLLVLACKNRLPFPYNLYCVSVGEDIKDCTVLVCMRVCVCVCVEVGDWVVLFVNAVPLYSNPRGRCRHERSYRGWSFSACRFSWVIPSISLLDLLILNN